MFSSISIAEREEEPEGILTDIHYRDRSRAALWHSGGERKALIATQFAGPTGTWAAVSVARALPPVTGSLGMLGTPLLGIAASVVLLGESVTWPLVLGTMLVIAGIAIVIVERAK